MKYGEFPSVSITGRALLFHFQGRICGVKRIMVSGNRKMLLGLL